MDLTDREPLERSLRKKSNKSRLNRLKKLGHLTLRTVETGDDLEGIVDQLTAQYDVRQGAVNDVCPFREDTKKRGFQIELMKIPHLTHTSALMLDDEVIASHIGVVNGSSLSLGVYSHSAVHAGFSPGKFLILMLGLELADKGVKCLDLTPGGEWKDRFATNHDEVEAMTVFLEPNAMRRLERNERLTSVAKRCLAMAHVTPAQARAASARLARAKPASVAREIEARLWLDREYRVYYYPAAAARQLDAEAVFSRDRPADLLSFEPTEPWQSRQTFLATALKRLENGNHVYTLVENDRLVHCGWLIERQVETFFPEVDQSFAFPANTAVLFDFFTHPDERGRGLYQAAMRRMLFDAAADPALEQISIAALADNRASINAIEKVGFNYATSLYLRRRALTTERWSGASTQAACAL
jgi:RimJ/RimL family protein N-acetyltransferase